MKSKRFLSFDAAKKYIHSLKLERYNDFVKLVRQNRIPRNIPASPELTYRGHGWTSRGDWIGPTYNGTCWKLDSKGKFYRRGVRRLTFQEAKSLCVTEGIKSIKEYQAYVKKHKTSGLVLNPNITYAGQGWKGFVDYLGTDGNRNSIGKRKKSSSYVSYQEAKKIIAPFELKTWTDWYAFRCADWRPLEVPSTPERYYKSKGWVSMKDFLSVAE